MVCFGVPHVLRTRRVREYDVLICSGFVECVWIMVFKSVFGYKAKLEVLLQGRLRLRRGQNARVRGLSEELYV